MHCITLRYVTPLLFIHPYVSQSLRPSVSLYFNCHFSRWTCVSRYQNVSILDIIGAKDDGGDDDQYVWK